MIDFGNIVGEIFGRKIIMVGPDEILLGVRVRVPWEKILRQDRNLGNRMVIGLHSKSGMDHKSWNPLFFYPQRNQNTMK